MDSGQTSVNSGSAQTARTMTVGELRSWLRQWVMKTTGLPEEEISDDEPMQSFGLSSRDVVILSGELETLFGVQLDATIAYEYPTIAALAQRLIDGEPEGRHKHTFSRKNLNNSQDLAVHDIAIVGMAARYPGAENIEEMWKLLSEGRSGTGTLPEGRWSEYAGDEGLQKRMAEQNLTGGYLEDISSFDPEFFGLSPLEAKNIDPQQRIILELAWEALEDAHIPANELRGEPVGVFIGSSNNDYGMLIAADSDEMHPYALTGTASSVIANRISYAFDFRGPSINLDTACSSSLVAAHEAIRALRAGDADVALAGGVNILASPVVSTAFGELGVFSPSGSINAFSDDADGFIRSDGAGVLVLKRVADAIADGDNIIAVIKGSAVNSDGHSNGLTAPNPEAQIDVLERAYADAGVDPAEVDYIEAHGTGTILGDPIEATALGAVLGQDRDQAEPTLLGSAKTNFGHTEAAAGAAGLIKTALAIEHDTIPASLNFTEPNRYIDFEQTHLEVVQDPREWPEYSGKKIAGVSGFGFGGTNAHVVLSSFDPAEYETTHEPVEAQLPEGNAVALPVSGLLPSRRKRAAAALADFLEGRNDNDLVPVARSLAKRNHGRSRAVVLANTTEEAVKRLRQVADGKVSVGIVAADAPAPQGPVFVYSGFGSQHRKMAKELVALSPAFRRRLEELDEIIQFESGWSLMEIIEDDGQTYDTETAQVAITAIQIALTDLLALFGAKPAAVMGMSMGEIAAAYAAGGLSDKDAMLIACHRSQLMGEGEQSLPEELLGAMAVVEFSVDDLDEFIANNPEFAGIEPAVYTAPGMTTVGGPREAVVALVERLEGENKFARLLNVKGAGHTSAVEPILGELAGEIAGIEVRPLQIPLFSSVDRGVVYQPGSVVHDEDYWLRCTRQSVWLQDATEQAFAAGYSMMVEIAPNPVALMGLMNTAFSVGKPDAQLLYAQKRKVPAGDALRELLAKFYVTGMPIDFSQLYGEGRVISAPHVPWKKQECWTDARPSSTNHAELPGTKVVLPDGVIAFSSVAEQVPSSEALIERAAEEVLPGARLIAFEESSALPSAGPITTVVSKNIGGLAIAVYRVVEDTSILVAEGFAVAGTVASGMTEDLAQSWLTASDEETPAQEDAQAPTASELWDPESGESVETRMRVIVSEAMGYDAEDLPDELPLIDLGLDSLMGMRIKNRIEHEFQIPELQVQALRDASVADVISMVEDLIAGKGTEEASEQEVAHTPAAQDAPTAVGADNTQVALPPRDASERLVFGTWASATGSAMAGVTTPLPAISAEVAAKIAARLTERSGLKITSQQVQEATALEQLADLVRDGLETDVDGNIRVLRARPEGSEAPAVFMFHPAGGSSSVYQPLMRRLPAEVPVYGVERLEGSLEDRASAYLDDIEKFADGRPVVLGGWSFGGALAFEVAHLLKERKPQIKVDFIALLDTVSPRNPIPDTPEETKKRWERYAAFAKKTYNLDFPVPYDLLETAGEDALLGMLTEILTSQDAAAHGVSAGVLEHQRASFVDNRILDTVDFSRWADVAVPVILFRAERMHEGALELEPAYADIAEDGGWGAIVDDLEIVHVNGDHLAIVDEPEISKVAAAMTRRINGGDK